MTPASEEAGRVASKPASASLRRGLVLEVEWDEVRLVARRLRGLQHAALPLLHVGNIDFEDAERWNGLR